MKIQLFDEKTIKFYCDIDSLSKKLLEKHKLWYDTVKTFLDVLKKRENITQMQYDNFAHVFTEMLFYYQHSGAFELAIRWQSEVLNKNPDYVSSIMTFSALREKFHYASVCCQVYGSSTIQNWTFNKSNNVDFTEDQLEAKAIYLIACNTNQVLSESWHYYTNQQLISTIYKYQGIYESYKNVPVSIEEKEELAKTIVTLNFLFVACLIKYDRDKASPDCDLEQLEDFRGRVERTFNRYLNDTMLKLFKDINIIP